MATILTLDPRFPIPESLSSNDPSHPMNLVKTATEVQNQAAADTKYDIPTPERFRKKEGFRSPFNGPSDIALAAGLLAFLVFVWFAIGSTMRSLYIFVLMLAFGIFFLVHKKAFDA